MEQLQFVIVRGRCGIETVTAPQWQVAVSMACDPDDDV